MRILIIEDDHAISRALKQLLHDCGYAVDISSKINSAECMLNSERFDLILLDLGLPDGDGSTLLKNIRQNKRNLNHQTPVLIITARDAVIAMVSNLDLGADDYLVKPFEFAVLIAKIKAIIRRSKGFANSIIHYGNIELCINQHLVKQDGKNIDLSAKEFALLQKFIHHQGCVFTRLQLEQSIYNFENIVGSNAIEVHIHNLRKKLGKNIIKTIRGVGYFAPEL